MTSPLRSAALLLSLLIALLLAPATATAGTVGGTWTSIGPFGGSVWALAVAPSDPQTVYAGTSAAGVWKSTDGGSSWRPTASIGSASVQAIVVDAADPRLLFAATAGNGVWKSADGGASWRSVSRGLPELTILSLARDPHAPDTLYAGTGQSGLWKSVTGGAQWFHPGRGLRKGQVLSIALDPRDPRVVYAAPNSGLVAGVYKSTDGGLTWQAKNAALPSPAAGRLAYQLALDPASPDVVYADLGPSGIFRSDDGAEHWTATVLGGFPMAVGAGVVFTASNEVSFDGGFTLVRTALESTWNAQAIALDPHNSARVFVGAYQGIFRSVDGAASFRRVNRGLAATWIRNLAVDGAPSPTLYAGVYGLDLEKRPSGRTWRSANLSAVGTGLQIDPRSPATLYTINYSEIEKSDDAGAHWEPIEFYNDGCFSIAQLAVDAQSPATVYAVGFEQSGRCPHDCYTFVSRDAGAHWTCMATLGGATSIAIDAQSSQTLYAANYDRTPWRSDDGGKHWARSGRGVPARSFQLVAASPVQGGLIYGATYPPGVFTSTDGGRTFGKPGLGLPNAIASNLVGDPADPRIVYAGFAAGTGNPPEQMGVYASTDQGRTWSRLGTGLPSEIFSGQLTVDPVNRLLYAGTIGAGVFQIPLL